MVGGKLNICCINISKRLKTTRLDIETLKMKKIFVQKAKGVMAILPLVMILFSSCYSTFTAQSAKTLEPGKVAGGIAMGGYTLEQINYDSQNYSQNKTSQSIPMIPVGLFRVGVVDNLDFNVQTNLITNSTIGLKYQLLKNEIGSNFSMGVNLGAIHFFYIPIFKTIEIPFYYSYHTKDKHVLYATFNPGWVENAYRQAGGIGAAFKISKTKEAYLFFEVKQSTVGKPINYGLRRTTEIDQRFILYGFGFTFGGF